MMQAGKLGFFKATSLSLSLIFIIITLVSIIYTGLHEKSFEPVIRELGNKFLYATQQLSSSSLQIIEQGGILPTSGGFWGSTWSFLVTMATFFSSFYIIYLWIFVLSKVISMSPFSENGKTFINYTLAIIIFLLLQSIILFTAAGINKELDCFSGCEKSTIKYLSTPYLSFYNFYKAVPYFLKPAMDIGDKVLNKNPANIANTTI